MQCNNTHSQALVKAVKSWVRSSHRLVHLVLRIGLGAEELVRARRGRGGEGLGGVGEQEEVIEEEGPQLLVALGLVEAAAVEELAWAKAVGEGVEDQVLGGRGG